jgi:hypothetical protein
MSKIDYSLRPAKHVERRMLVDALRRLTPFGAVESYRYIGFGAVYFRDFILMHRELGITEMLSIERDTFQKERYEFNRPFACVRQQFAEASAVLPTLDWGLKTILWLDYEGQLDSSNLSDIGFFCANAPPGSVLIVTVNVQADHPKAKPLDALQERVKPENVPADIDAKSLTGWGLATVSRRIVVNKIRETLDARNGGRPDLARFDFKQLFNFHYEDDARMLTVGGLLYERGQQHILSSCSFEQLRFVRTAEEPYRIDVPKLTYKELRFVDAQLPAADIRSVERRGIPMEELQRYESLYRYFPAFAVTDI